MTADQLPNDALPIEFDGVTIPDGYRMYALQDDTCDSPADTDGFLTTFVQATRYPVTVGSNGEAVANIAYRFDTPEVLARYLRVFHGAYVEMRSIVFNGAMIPALAIVTRESVTWAGFEWDADTLADVVEGERFEYNEWALGNCFGVILERRAALARVPADTRMTFAEYLATPEADLHNTWETVDSVWGFIGGDHDKSGLLDAAKEMVENI